MSKSYYSLGLMSGTSGDGVDTSIIQSDGDTQYKVIFDKYFKYTQDIYENIHNLKDKINNSKDLKNLSKEMEPLEKEITLFHARAVNEIIKESKSNIDFIGFHGQTVYHNAKEKISKQLGDGKLLSQLTKKTVIYDFRQNDLKNDGQGAPLTPMFHKLLAYKYKFKIPLTFLNIGGISNLTHIDHLNNLWGWDVGPGNCLIDQWVRLNSKNKYDQDGKIARSGKINKIVLNSALESYPEINSSDDRPKSYDVKDFDLSFVQGLSLEDGAATLTEYTAEILTTRLRNTLAGGPSDRAPAGAKSIVITGGGRKNKLLIKSIREKMKVPILLIDDYGINGDFIESQAFAYLAIRSYLKLPISFPETTGVTKPSTGGVIINN